MKTWVAKINRKAKVVSDEYVDAPRTNEAKFNGCFLWSLRNAVQSFERLQRKPSAMRT